MRPVSEERDAATPKESKDVSPQFAHVLTGAVATTPQKSLLTPVKSTATGQGQLYYSRQNRTPSAHLAYLQVASPHVLKTPGSGGKFRTPGSGSSRKGTPRLQHGSVYNPFEAGLLDHLNSPMVSPNVFRMTEPGSSEKTPQSFRWSIDQLASLKPVPIEEMPQHQANAHATNHEVEWKAQTAIDRFFESNAVVPSPWTDSAKKKPFQLPRTPRVEPDSPMCESTQVEGPARLGRKEVACQTGLTLPMDFDLQKVLGDYYTQPAPANEEANLSSSSLRRKLFFHGDEGTPLSPVKGSKSQLTEAMDLSCLSPLVSPVRHQTPLRSGRLSPFNTPGSAHFSSSPVHKSSCSSSSRSAVTPGLRRCSTTSELVMSPQLSPIGPRAASPKELCHSEPTSPHHAHWQATPSSGCTDLAMQLMDSPGMSPIAIGDGSFMESSLTPNSARSASSILRGRRRRPQLVPTPADLRPSDSPQFARRSASNRGAAGKFTLHSDDEDTGMDISSHYFTSPRTSQENPTLDFKSASAFSEIREAEVHDESTNQGLCLQMDMLSHDTGYHTNSQDTGYSNSLHLTNQDMASNCNSVTAADPAQHCDLTNPFSQLPLPQDPETNLNSNSNSETSDFVEKFSEEPEAAAESFNEDRIIRKARVLLGKKPEQTPPESAGDRHKLMESIGVPSFAWHRENMVLGTSECEHEKTVSDTAHVLPSVLASQVLKRAGEDFARYCNPGNDDASLSRDLVQPKAASTAPSVIQCSDENTNAFF